MPVSGNESMLVPTRRDALAGVLVLRGQNVMTRINKGEKHEQVAADYGVSKRRVRQIVRLECRCYLLFLLDRSIWFII